MMCATCGAVWRRCERDLAVAREHVKLPPPREPLYDGEEVGLRTITDARRAELREEIAVLERVIDWFNGEQSVNRGYPPSFCDDPDCPGGGVALRATRSRAHRRGSAGCRW